MLKVRESDMALLKEVVEPARSKYQQVRLRGGLCAGWLVEDTARCFLGQPHPFPCSGRAKHILGEVVSPVGLDPFCVDDHSLLLLAAKA